MSRDDPSRCRLVQAGRLAAAVVRNGGHGIFRRSRAASSCHRFRGRLWNASSIFDRRPTFSRCPRARFTRPRSTIRAGSNSPMARRPKMVHSFRATAAEARRHGNLYFAALLSQDRILKAFGTARAAWQGWVYSPAITVWVFLPNASVQIILAATRWPDSSPGVWHKVSRRVRPRRSINRRYLDSLGPSATLRGSSEAPGRETLCDAVASTPERKRRRGHEFVCTCFACHGHVYPIATT